MPSIRRYPIDSYSKRLSLSSQLMTGWRCRAVVANHFDESGTYVWNCTYWICRSPASPDTLRRLLSEHDIQPSKYQRTD